MLKSLWPLTLVLRRRGTPCVCPKGAHKGRPYEILIEICLLTGVFFLPYSKSIAEIGFAGAFFFFLCRKMFCREKLSLGPSALPYLIFLFCAVLSLTQVTPPDLPTALRGVLKWSQYFFLLLVAFEFSHDPGRRDRLITCFLITMVLVSLNGFIQMFTGFDLIKKYAYDLPGRFPRISSSFQSPNGLAAFLLLALPLLISMWARQKHSILKSGALLTASILMSAVFLGTFSRAAFFGLLIAASTLFIAKRQFPALLGLIAGILLLFASSHLLRANFIETLHFKDITIAERVKYWSAARNMIRAHPFLGNGINMYTAKLPSFNPPAVTYVGYAHNCYLQIWSEVGVFGLMAFLYALFRPLITGVMGSCENVKETMRDALWVGITAFLIQAAFDTNFFALQAAMMFWVMWGVYLATLKRDPG